MSDSGAMSGEMDRAMSGKMDRAMSGKMDRAMSTTAVKPVTGE